MSRPGVWRPVPGVPGYQVSDGGQVRSWSPWKRGELLQPWLDKDGYQYVSLYRGGEKHTRRVHRLVLEAFVGPCPDGHQAAHWDGDKTNNRVSNLRWASPADNVADMLRMGRHAQARKAACPAGHPYSGDNLYTHPDGSRRCRACKRERRAQLASV